MSALVVRLFERRLVVIKVGAPVAGKARDRGGVNGPIRGTVPRQLAAGRIESWSLAIRCCSLADGSDHPYKNREAHPSLPEHSLWTSGVARIITLHAQGLAAASETQVGEVQLPGTSIISPTS